MRVYLSFVALCGCWLVPSLPAADDRTQEFLGRWEAASERMQAPAADVLQKRFGATHSAHELEVAFELLGEVRADRLVKRFEWTHSTAGDGAERLSGRPRDGLAQLFFSAVEVRFDRETDLPESIRFRDRDGRLRAQTITAAGRLRTTLHRPILLPVPDDKGDVELAANVVQADQVVPLEPARRPGPILDRWEAATRELRTVELRFTRYVYDAMRQVEARGEGRFYFEAPNRGLYELHPVAVAVGEQSQRTGTGGERFQVVPEDALTCVWNGTHLVRVDEEERTFERIPLPETLQSDVRPVGSWDMVWAGMAGPQRSLPGVVDVHTDEFLTRFEWSVLKQDERQVLLLGRPILQQDRFHISELKVILNPRTYLASATRLTNADGSRETVHVFQYQALNRGLAPERSNWEPDLSRYRELTLPPPAPPAAIDE